MMNDAKALTDDFSMLLSQVLCQNSRLATHEIQQILLVILGFLDDRL